MITYQTQGKLVHPVPTECVAEAMAYLVADDMTQYLDESIANVVAHVQWALHADGEGWHVTAKATRELTADELRVLSQWVSGQNSDGLGEGFEQQAFAEIEDEDYEETCYDCGGSGYNSQGEDDDEECTVCYGDGTIMQDGESTMCSFDWKTNDCAFERVA